MQLIGRIHNCVFFSYYMIRIVISFALVKFYALAILSVLIVMQIKLVVVVVCYSASDSVFIRSSLSFAFEQLRFRRALRLSSRSVWAISFQVSNILVRMIFALFIAQ